MEQVWIIHYETEFGSHTWLGVYFETKDDAYAYATDNKLRKWQISMLVLYEKQ